MIAVREFNRMDYDKKRHFNCGGYALGTLDWYIPPRIDKVYSAYEKKWKENYSEEQVQKAIAKAVYLVADEMVEQFDGLLRIIQKEEDKKSYEEIVYFRFSDEDFHFVVKKGDVCYHKRGGTPHLEKLPLLYVKNYEWKNGPMYYDSPIIIFAKVKKPFHELFKNRK